MVNWVKALFGPPERCGPLCRAVQAEVAQIGRAELQERTAPCRPDRAGIR